MNKLKFTEEYELNASPKIIFPYLFNPVNLSEWFATDVTVDEGKVYNFVWDNTDHFAKLTATRINKQVKFEFLDDKKQEKENPDYIEFKLETSELTNATFLKVTDYSEMTDRNDLDDLWVGLIEKLREVLGS